MRKNTLSRVIPVKMWEPDFTSKPLFVCFLITAFPIPAFIKCPAFRKLQYFASLVYWGLISVRCADLRPCYFFSSVISNMRGWVSFDASSGRSPDFREFPGSTKSTLGESTSSAPCPVSPFHGCVRPRSELLGIQLRGGILCFFTPGVQAAPFWVLLSSDVFFFFFF